MNKDKIGVIVPVYKTEKFIAECIESILAQTYTNFRLILVDDGTPDNAGKICDEYAKKDNRITVIHQENAGVTRARAAGVEAANDCEWITFVDSDDTITYDALEVLLQEIGKHDCDIIINDLYIKEDTISISDYNKQLIQLNENIVLAPWGKLFKKELFNKTIFDIPREVVVGEDVIMNLHLSFASTKEYIIVIHKPIYRYNINRSESATKVHKKSLAYEEMFFKQLTKAIPIEERDLWLRETIIPRLRCWRFFWGYKYSVKDMKNTDFYKRLHADIKRYKYDMPVIDSIIFYNTNPIIRFFTINLKKIINKLS